uniref:Uncharacterized protein n=1 Tax=Clastoptera arizonana TaxID=38151 RepID=A0A1B6DXI4_9HEMI
MSGGVEAIMSAQANGESQDLTSRISNNNPLTHYFHQSPEHCSVSFAAINKMRQNSQSYNMTRLNMCRVLRIHGYLETNKRSRTWVLFENKNELLHNGLLIKTQKKLSR